MQVIRFLKLVPNLKNVSLWMCTFCSFSTFMAWDQIMSSYRIYGKVANDYSAFVPDMSFTEMFHSVLVFKPISDFALGFHCKHFSLNLTSPRLLANRRGEIDQLVMTCARHCPKYGLNGKNNSVDIWSVIID